MSISGRHPLPQRRHAEAFEISFWRQCWHVSVGYYEDRVTPGEIFINAVRARGTDLDAVCRDSAILFSLALQHGTPISVMHAAVTRDANGAPSSIVGAILDLLEQERQR